MAKRFIDTDLFRKPFMRSLDAPYKALWIYLLCECDHAGIWVVELDVAQMRLGMKLDPEKVLDKMGGAVIPIDGGKWYLPDFVEFQYGTLNPANRVHASVIDRLSKCGIDTDQRPEIKPLASPLQGAKDKEKDKEKDKDKDFTQGRKERATEVDTAFEALWITFERWGAKGKALGYWKRLSEEERASVVRNAPAYVASTPGCAFRKQLEGWINPDNRLWERPIVQKPPEGVLSNGKMTSDQAREAIAALRTKHGIKPGGAIDSHLIPDHIREALR